MNPFLSGFLATIDAQKIGKSTLVKFGQIATLDDKIFAQENGSTGYWKPLTFLRDFGVGVYFLEPYAPKKIPVLFIHLSFYLLFSYRGDCQLLLKNNDGTVELSSELDCRAQNSTKQVYGFDEDHGSIVYSQTFIEYFNQILKENQSK